MFSFCISCLIATGELPPVILSWTSGILRLYPAFMKTVGVLQKLVQ
jgi:hypothetical protein